jgi:hypothetical protein
MIINKNDVMDKVYLDSDVLDEVILSITVLHQSNKMLLTRIENLEKQLYNSDLEWDII